MNAVLRPDLGNFLLIGGMAFLLVWGTNRALRAVGKPQWTTTGS